MRHRPQPGQKRLWSADFFNRLREVFAGTQCTALNQPIARLWPIVAALDRNSPNKIAPSKFCISNRAVTCDIVGRALIAVRTNGRMPLRGRSPDVGPAR